MARKTRPEDIVFEKVLTDQSQYGLIWLGKNKALNCPCVIKMVVLRRLAHYDQDKGKWINEQGKRDKNATKWFQADGDIPFTHSAFAKHKSMSMENFKLEIRNVKMLDKLGLGVRYFTAWMERDPKVPVDYGFCAVEKGEGTIKDLILKKEWRKRDHSIVKELIRKLHAANIIHRDIKPSNCCYWSDGKGSITRVAFIDCAKVRTRDDLGEKDFNKKLAKERPHFVKHIARNIKERNNSKKKK